MERLKLKAGSWKLEAGTGDRKQKSGVRRQKAEGRCRGTAHCARGDSRGKMHRALQLERKMNG